MASQPLLFLSPLHRAIRQIGIHLGERMSELDIQGNEGHLLSFLNSYAPVPVSEIARVFGMSKSTLTSMLDRLEKRKLIRRVPHPEDRRSLLVQITRRGRALATRVQLPITELEHAIREGITKDDLRGFHRVIEEIGNVTQVTLRPAPKEKP